MRRRLGLALAPAVFVYVWWREFPSLSMEGHHLAAVMAAVVVLWITETLPMPVTALTGAAACVVLRVAPAKAVFAPFADPIMFLFIGSFILARAIFLHGLDRRLAFGVLSSRAVGARPGRVLFAFGAVTAFISAWISNTATTAMMFAIGMSILGFLFDHQRAGGPAVSRRFATGLMLMTSFAASIGGLATPIGTPPNLIGLGHIRDSLGVEIPFVQYPTHADDSLRVLARRGRGRGDRGIRAAIGRAVALKYALQRAMVGRRPPKAVLSYPTN